VEAFILENDGTGTRRHGSYWGEFTDSTWKNEEMLIRLDQRFQRWLNSQAPLGCMASIRAQDVEVNLQTGHSSRSR
jgi:hypothetical protein